MADEELVNRIKGGDMDAFEAIVKAYERQVYNMALRYTGNPEDAHDVSQDVFIRVYRSISGFKGDCKFSTWFYQITMNMCIDFVRKSSRKREISILISDDDGETSELELPDNTYAPDEIYDKKEFQNEISECINNLGDEHKAIIVLRDINGLSYKEIGDILDMEQGTVKSRLFRARERLRKMLIKTGNFSKYSSSNKSKGGETHD